MSPSINLFFQDLYEHNISFLDESEAIIKEKAITKIALEVIAVFGVWEADEESHACDATEVKPLATAAGGCGVSSTSEVADEEVEKTITEIEKSRIREIHVGDYTKHKDDIKQKFGQEILEFLQEILKITNVVQFKTKLTVGNTMLVSTPPRIFFEGELDKSSLTTDHTSCESIEAVSYIDGVFQTINSSFLDCLPIQREAVISKYLKDLQDLEPEKASEILKPRVEAFLNKEEIRNTGGLCVGYSYSFILFLYSYLDSLEESFDVSSFFEAFKKSDEFVDAATHQLARYFSISKHENMTDKELSADSLSLDQFVDFISAIEKRLSDYCFNYVDVESSRWKLIYEFTELKKSLEIKTSEAEIVRLEEILKELGGEPNSGLCKLVDEIESLDFPGLTRYLQENQGYFALQISYDHGSFGHAISAYSDPDADLYLLFDSNRGVFQFETDLDLVYALNLQTTLISNTPRVIIITQEELGFFD